MRIVRFEALEFVPAGHENPLAPGVVKKVLAQKDDFQPGRVQMINWAKLLPGKRFARHYHEDMQEIFIIVQGTAEITVEQQRFMLSRGDAVVIDAREVHEMHNASGEDVDYLAIGITREAGGRTVLVE